MLRPSDVQVVRKGHLDGTIDGHDPIFATFRIKGDHGWFRLTVYSVNLGRGYSTQQFIANVRRLLASVGEREYVVILFQEIDEADPSPEHKHIREMINAEFKGSLIQFIQWFTREPIVVIGNAKVLHEGKRMTMDQGSTIGVAGLGPRRFIPFARLLIEGVRIGIANQHPHRYSQRFRKGVADLLDRGERVTRRVVGMLVRTCDMEIDGGDLNTYKYPKSHLKQKTAYQHGLDYIRYTVA